jgi:hypothetical protein
MNRATSRRAGQRALAFAVASMSDLFLRPIRCRDAIQQELVGLACEVAAVAWSAQCILSKAPDGPERQRLLHACEQLARAADEVVDPRNDLQHLSDSGLEDTIRAFVAHQEQSAFVRSAALAVAQKREPSSRAIRRSAGDQRASDPRRFATAGWKV